MTNPTILSCPVCATRLQGSPKTLYCSQCRRNHVAGPNGFFDFRNKDAPKQSKGLRADMDFGYVKEGAFSTFLSESILLDIDAFFSTLPTKTVLDIGCGNANLADLILQYADNYYGMEPSDANTYDGEYNSVIKKRYLIHNDAERMLPVINDSVDAVTFFASYDHIPYPRQVLADAWLKLKQGGYLIVTMSNYGFWLKALLNKISGKQLFLNEHEHYCVHSPATLTEEIRSFVNNIEVHTVIADSIYLPNLPGKFSHLYFSLDQVYSLNRLVYKMIHSVSKNKYLGATMIVVFKKIAK